MTDKSSPPLLSGRSALRRAPKMSERVARQLVDYIIDNDLPEGTMLPVESELVSALDVGRTTLREALLLLETWGVVTVKPGRNGGPVIRRPRPEDLREALYLQLVFASATLADVIEAREALEPMSARLAAERISPEDLAVLGETIDRMKNNLDSHSLFLEENRRFHSTIADATGSVVLRAFTDAMKAIADGAIVGVEYDRKRRAAVVTAHTRIVEAIRAGDGNAAEAAMRSHVAEAHTFWKTRAGGLASSRLRWLP